MSRRFNFPRFPGTLPYRVDYVDESLSLDVHECKLMSKQIRLSAFFGQQHKEETAEMSTEHDEAEPENDQWSEPKSKLLKCNCQQSWLEKYKQLKFNPPKGMFCLLCQKSNLISIS